MAVVPQGKRLPPILPPFQRRDVEEWSTLDSLTGILEHARVQTDHWAATTCNSSHHFGKVIDSRARNLADGSKEQRQQTKQLEVFQANIPGGSVQVIRSQSLTTSSWQGQSTTTKLGSGSSWSARANSKNANKNEDTEFDNLKLALNPLDISSQKMKASVVRRGSIGTRRPPTRPRSIAGSRSDKPGQIMEEEEVADGLNHLNSSSSNISNSNKLSQTSRICQQYHQEAKNNASFHSSLKSSSTLKQSYLANGNDSSLHKDKRPSSGPVTLSFLLDSKKESLDSKNTIKKSPLVHKKSCSSEDLRLSPETSLLDSEDCETGDDWKRSSKARRSLQFPVQSKSEQNNYSSEIKSVNSVLKVAKEIEARKQIVTNSLKNNQWEDVLKSVVSSQNLEKNNSEMNSVEDELVIKDNKVVKKKPSFITVESLKEVRGRLRRLNSTVTDETKYEDEDDGIVTELKGDSPIDELEDTPKSVKSYVYGMESLLRNSSTSTNRPTTITGTGSLESRSTSKSSCNGSNRSEEWYNRRKSYGFEQVNGQSSTQGTSLYGDKNKVDSSTDSGICRSSETVANVQFWNKPLTSNPDGNNIKTSHTITIKRIQDKDDNERESPTKQDGFNSDLVQKGRKTVVTLGVGSKNSTWSWNNPNDKSQIDEQANHVGSGEAKEVVSRGKIADAIRSLRERASEVNGFESRRLSEPITISIPVSTLDDSEIIENSGLLLKQTKEPSTIEKLNLSKQFNDDANQFSTSYSKLLYGTNYSDNEQNIKSNTPIVENKNNVHLQVSSWNRHASAKDNDFKRHSIAVDEAKYMEGSSKETFEMPSVKDKIASFKNQFDLKSNSNEKLILPIGSSNSLPSDKNKISSVDNDIDSNTNEKKHKKVEFCKTEVHFAAEPGRFNIVETDGKPPSSNMFRRRRRTIAETPVLRSNLPEIRFGDSQYEKDLLTCCELNDPDGEKSSPPKASSPIYRLSPQFIDNNNEDGGTITQGNTLVPIESDSHEEMDVSFKINDLNQEDNEEKPRSILKHNVHKQLQCNHIEDIKTSYENTDNPITNQSNISLKLVATDSKTIPWKSTVRLQQNAFSSDDSESELQKLLKTLRPVAIKQNTVVSSYNPSSTSSGVDSSATAADNGLAVRISSAMNLPDQRRASWSVSERVRHVEDSKNRGFSTKVNFGSGEPTVVTPELQTSPVRDLMSTGWISESINNSEVPSAKKVQQVVSSKIVPTYVGSSNKVKSVETLVSTRSGHPKITSISLRYADDGNNESGKSSDTLQSVSRNEIGKCSIFKAHSETIQNTNVFKSESNANKITGYSPADNVLINSKMSKSPSRLDISETDVKFKSSLNQLNSSQNEAIYEEIKMNDDVVPQKLPSQVLITNRKTHSPSSDSVFVERTVKQQSIFNQVNSRNRSMSPVPFPTRPVMNLPDYANTRQINMMQKHAAPTRITAGDSTVWSSVTVNKTKKKEVVKKDDIKKKSPDDNLIQKDAAIKLPRKDRRPSTNSSGRDGWLNTPKENNAKQRVNNSQTRRQTNIDSRKDKKIVSSNSTYKIENSAKTSIRHGAESPIYQNREVYSKTQKDKDPFESLETESAILEELTRAADQILLAVNGYTDEESIRASSDDEFKRKHTKEKPPSKPLSTISEMPVKRKTISTALKKENLSKTSGSPVHSSVGASSRTKLCKTSSNSSIEGTVEAKSLLTEERSKRRAARLLQRASSRELLLQNTGASSSEDVASGTENTPQRNKQRVVRRTAKQYSSRTSHQNSTVASTSRTKDRVQQTEGRTVDEKEHVIHSRRRPDEKSKTSRVSTSGSGRTSMPPTGAIRCERSSRLVERRPPEKPGGGGGGTGGYGGGGGVGRTRNQHALSKKKCTSGASHREMISQPIK